MLNEVINGIGMKRRPEKLITNIVSWSYFLLRIYFHYSTHSYNLTLLDHYNADLMAGISFLIYGGDHIAKTIDFYFSSLQN